MGIHDIESTRTRARQARRVRFQPPGKALEVVPGPLPTCPAAMRVPRIQLLSNKPPTPRTEPEVTTPLPVFGRSPRAPIPAMLVKPSTSPSLPEFPSLLRGISASPRPFPARVPEPEEEKCLEPEYDVLW